MTESERAQKALEEQALASRVLAKVVELIEGELRPWATTHTTAEVNRKLVALTEMLTATAYRCTQTNEAYRDVIQPLMFSLCVPGEKNWPKFTLRGCDDVQN
jgi:hypothetical protein